MTWLLDGNVLVALAIDSHVHHDRARRWFGTLAQDPVRHPLDHAGDFAAGPPAVGRGPRRGCGLAFAEGRGGHPQHDWWDDALSFLDVPHRHLQGSAQVTDAWLAELARRRGGRLVTLDSGLDRLHGDVALLLPRKRAAAGAGGGSP